MTPDPAPAAAGRDAGRHPGPDLLWIAALVAAATSFWIFDVLRPGALVVSLANYDLFAEFFPRHHYAGSALARGELPLWDPHQIGGMPFLATLQGGVLYPPNALYAALPTGAAMGALALLHLALAGVAMYALARELGSSREGSALAGVAFMLGGATPHLVHHTNAINAAPWLPVALLCAARAGRLRSVRWALLLGLTLALQLLAGRDYAVVMTVHAVGLFALFQLGWLVRERRGAAACARHAALLAVAAASAAGLAAIQLLPTLELAAASGRALSGVSASLLDPFGPMPPSLYFANLVNPARGALRREYLGWLPLLCFLAGFRLWGRDRAAVFASATALLALLLCFGPRTPLYDLYVALPLGGVFRLPDRFAFLLTFGVALGASRGFDRLCGAGAPDPARRRDLLPGAALIAAFGASLALAVGSGWLATAVRSLPDAWPRWFYGFGPEHFAGLSRAPLYFAAASAVLAALAWRAGSRPLRLAIPLLAAADLGFASESRLLHPARAAGPALAGAPCYAQLAALLPPWGRHLSLRLADSYAIKDKDGELFGTFSATHYEPLVSRRHARYFAALQAGGPPLMDGPRGGPSPFMGFLTAVPDPARARLLDLLGVGAVLVDGRPARRPAALDALLGRFERRARCRVPAVGGLAPVDLYANPHALPRAWVAQRVSPASGPDDALRRVLEPRFDPRREVVVEGWDRARAPDGAEGEARARITHYAPRRVVVEVSTPRAAALVLGDSWDADWRAAVDGVPAPVRPANALFRAVAVPAGDSRVEFRYVPRAFRLGAAISGASAVLWGGLWLAARGRGAP